MSSQLTVDELASRLNSFPYDRYLYIGSFMRSVAWAAATVVLLAIVRNRTIYLPRLLPWTVSFLATMVTLMTWGRGILFTNSRANLLDSILPTLMGIVEFCLFAILAPPQVFGGGGGAASDFDLATRTGRFVGNLHAWHFWFFVLAAHTALAVVLVANRISQTDLAHDFDPKLSGLAGSYMTWMRADRSGAWTATKASLVFGVVMILAIHLFRSYQQLWIRMIIGGVYLALFVMPIVKLSGAIIDAERQRQEADDQVSKLVTAPPTPTPAVKQLPAKPGKSLRHVKRHRVGKD